MKKSITTKEQALNKLIRPVHISYICSYILKSTLEECQETINEWIKEGLVEESQYGKEYYARTKRNG
jgi:hypothetical protein